jgi:hypothetical protein
LFESLVTLLDRRSKEVAALTQIVEEIRKAMLESSHRRLLIADCRFKSSQEISQQSAFGNRAQIQLSENDLNVRHGGQALADV